MSMRCPFSFLERYPEENVSLLVDRFNSCIITYLCAVCSEVSGPCLTNVRSISLSYLGGRIEQMAFLTCCK